MPSGVNKYDKTCLRCKKKFVAKMGVQKYCLTCGNYILKLRQYGFIGDWSIKAEKKFNDKKTKGK